MDLMKKNNITEPVFNVDIAGQIIDAAGGNIHVRIYNPKCAKDPFQVIVYHQGSGFVIANLDDAVTNAPACQTKAIVVSVAYRLAPEHKFPITRNDASATYQWVLNNAPSFKGDLQK